MIDCLQRRRTTAALFRKLHDQPCYPHRSRRGRVRLLLVMASSSRRAGCSVKHAWCVLGGGIGFAEPVHGPVSTRTQQPAQSHCSHVPTLAAAHRSDCTALHCTALLHTRTFQQSYTSLRPPSPAMESRTGSSAAAAAAAAAAPGAAALSLPAAAVTATAAATSAALAPMLPFTNPAAASTSQLWPRTKHFIAGYASGAALVMVSRAAAARSALRAPMPEANGLPIAR